MKKIALLLAAIAACAISASAQSLTTLVATLTHNGEHKSFYGYEALVGAYNAAEAGDLITLSPGTFQACDIEKPITLRGAGCNTDSTAYLKQTVLAGDFWIKNLTDSVHSLVVEGIFHNYTMQYENVKNAHFLRCRFNNVLTAGNRTINNSKYNYLCFTNCIIASQLDVSDADSNSTSCNCHNHFEIINSIVNYPDFKTYNSSYDKTCSINAENSIIIAKANIYNSTIKNCFIVSSGEYLMSDCYMSNNIGITTYSNLFQYAFNTSNTIVEDGSELFENYDIDHLDSCDFHIKESAKAQCTKDEGEVGIYGGTIPFSTETSNPQIKKFEVASKSNYAGKLPVTIQIGLPE